MTMQPEHVYALLDARGGIRTMPGGGEFWAQPEPALDALGRDWLVSEFTCDADWASWEMHPGAEEFVYLLDGDIDFLLEAPDGSVTSQHLNGRGAVVVPRGHWHTAKVHRPSRMFFITMGAGTQHRPA